MDTLGRQALTLVILASVHVSAALAAPLFLDVAPGGTAAGPLRVMAGRTAEFRLALTSAQLEHPQLKADLSAVAGRLAAPLLTDTVIDLRRTDEARPGVQRFKFSLAIPAVERKQQLLLRLSVRPDPKADWLPLPPVQLEAVPRTWPDTLAAFARQVPCGRLAGSDALERLFGQAQIETAVATSDQSDPDPSIKVWFAEAGADEFRPPAASPAIWIVFKENVPGGLELWRPNPKPFYCVAADAAVLAAVDSDPAAQELFERALAAALLFTRENNLVLP